MSENATGTEEPSASGRKAPRDPRQSSLFVNSIEKGMTILTAFDRSQPVLGLRDLMAVTGLDQSSVQRFAHTLHTLGYLRKDPATRKFSLSPKVLELGFAYIHGSSLIDYVTPVLYRLNAKWGECFSMTEMVDAEVVFVARVPGHHTISVDVLLGTRMPAYAAASGRAMLAFMPRESVEEVFAQSELRLLTPHTVTDPADLMAALDDVRRQGYALAVDQCYLGDLTAAAPILNPQGLPVAAINVSVPTNRWNQEDVVTKLVPDLVEAAAHVSSSHIQWGSHSWFAKTLSAGPRR